MRMPMIIKNVVQVLFMTAVSIINIHAMETPNNSCLDREKRYAILSKIPQFCNYEDAKKLHAKHNTPETEALLEDAAAQFLATEKGQEILCAATETQEIKLNPIAIYSNRAVYSDNVVTKYNIMKTSAAYQQHEDAKMEHQKYKTANTLYMVDLCKKELLSSKECLDFLRAMEQDKITLLHKKQTPHTNSYNSFSSLTEQQPVERHKNKAWDLFVQTPEYKLFQDAKKEHALHNTEKTLALFQMHRDNAIKTPQYNNYASIAFGPRISPIIITRELTQPAKPNICPYAMNKMNKKIKPNQKPFTIEYHL